MVNRSVRGSIHSRWLLRRGFIRVTVGIKELKTIRFSEEKRHIVTIGGLLCCVADPNSDYRK